MRLPTWRLARLCPPTNQRLLGGRVEAGAPATVGVCVPCCLAVRLRVSHTIFGHATFPGPAASKTQRADFPLYALPVGFTPKLT